MDNIPNSTINDHVVDPQDKPDMATNEWLKTLATILVLGGEVNPRGKPVLELLNQQVHVDMRWPVVACLNRKLSYKFMAAEALWICDGDNSVNGIAPYLPKIKEFSDNETSFFGAYGPPISEQWEYILNSLLGDPFTRQAVLTIWRQRPTKSRDIPCTVSLQWLIRNRDIHCVANMRSSDVWLGLPYDIFNFTILTAKLACQLNNVIHPKLRFGGLTINMASSHLYLRNIERATKIFEDEQKIGSTEELSDRVIAEPGAWDRIIRPSLINTRDHPGYSESDWRIRPRGTTL